MPRLSAGDSYVCMSAHPQEHTCKNLQERMKLVCAENACLILQAQLQPYLGALSGGSEISNVLSEI